MYEVINVTCAEMESAVGFLYERMNQTLGGGCEQSWYSEDGLKVADPSDPQKLISPVISVSSDRLVSSLCVNLNHEIICDSADGTHFSHVSSFRVRNETAVIPNSDEWLWIWAVVVVIAVLVIILICFLRQKKKCRCLQSIAQRDDSENRDPESGVRMKLRSDQSDSPNQSVLRSSE